MKFYNLIKKKVFFARNFEFLYFINTFVYEKYSANFKVIIETRKIS